MAQTSGTKQQNPETIRPDISARGTSRRRSNLPQDVKAAQQALQEKGHNPGPIDGMMGPRMREALKSLQSASGLETTGTLDQATAGKLGVDLGPSKGSKDMNTGKSSSR